MPGDFQLGDFRVHPDSDRLSRGDTRIDLEPKTMAVLLALAARPGEVVSSEELIRDVWHGRPMGDNPVYKAIAKLRRALDDETAEPRFIETIARKGYRLLVSPQPVADASATAAVDVPEPPRSATPASKARAVGIGFAAAASIALAAAIGWYAVSRTAESPPSTTTARPMVHSVYFPGLESDSTRITNLNDMIHERLARLPDVTISGREIDRPLASLRLTGSAHAEDDQVHVRLRLEGGNGRSLWSQDLDVPVEETWRIVDQVAAAVHEAASFDERKDKLAALPFAALQAYLQARSELGARRPGFAARMLAASREVVRLAPDFASGHASLAVACAFSDDDDHDSTAAIGALECARTHAARALELDPELAEAHAAAGLVAAAAETYCREECDAGPWRVSARQSLERAVRLDPTLPEARSWLGVVYSDIGDLARANEQAEAALALDPLSPIANVNVNAALIARGRNELARERLTRLARTQGMPWQIYHQLAEIALANRSFAEAQSWARPVVEMADTRGITLAAAVILARSGDPAEASALYERAMAEPPPIYTYDLFHAVRVQQRLGGQTAVHRMLDTHLARLGLGTPADVPDDADRDLRIVVGWTFVLADDPIRALPWLESSFGRSGAPLTRYADPGPETEGLLAYAWAAGQAGDALRARALAQSTLDYLTAIASVGFDQNAPFALVQALALKLAGRRADAITELERAYALGWAEPHFIQHDPRWSSFADEPAVRDLLARVDQRAAGARIAAAP